MSMRNSQLGPSSSDAAPEELMVVVDDLLNNLTAKFSDISAQMMSRMDDMSRRLDKLETAIQQSAAQNNNNTTSSK